MKYILPGMLATFVGLILLTIIPFTIGAFANWIRKDPIEFGDSWGEGISIIMALGFFVLISFMVGHIFVR